MTKKRWFELNKNWLYIYTYWPIGLVGRVFPNSSGNRGSIKGRVIPKTQNMVLDTSSISWTIFIAVKVSLGRHSTYTILPLRMESNAFEKSTKNSVASRSLARIPLMVRADIQNLCSYGSISLTRVRIFSCKISRFQVWYGVRNRALLTFAAIVLRVMPL